MKKLSLLLFAFCLSVMGWALNPNTDWNRLNTYVYAMGASLTTNNDTVVLTYKLNSEAVAGGDTYNDINPSSGGTGRGIQIYLLYKDEQGEWQRVQKDDGTGDYAFYDGTFKQGDNTAKIPVAGIPTNCKGKELTWEARVHGNVMRTQPTIVGEVTTKPYNAYGIAVNNDPTHKRFAQMYVSEAYPRQYSGWSKHGEDNVYKYANQMLEYTPLLGFQCAHFKHWHDGNVSHFASTWNWTQTIENFKITCTYSHNYEPNRIKVSEDGRIFTSSFHPKASCAVVEYSRGDRDTYNLGHHFYSTIKNNWDYNDDITNSDAIGGVDNPFLYRRCIGMDVKGKGENLKIILLWIDANACSYEKVQSAKFEIYEYEIGRAEKNGKSYLDPFDTASGYVHKIGEYDWDYKGAAAGGAFYQGARYGVRNDAAKTQLLYNNMLRGFADLAYGSNNDVWVKIDYCFSVNSTAQIIRIKLSDGSTTPYTVAKNATANYGGSGILIKGDLLITSPTDNTICMYQINANGELTATNNIPTAKYTITDNRIGTWVTGFATDYAGNLFSLTQAATNGENYTANVLGIAMPYKTAITTRAKGTFTVTDPIPNILATDLRFAPNGNSDSYVFSFNVNTTPQVAQIRFYKSYGDKGENDMKKNLAKINADDYQGGNAITPSFVYDIPTDQLKQGKISVSLGMCGGIIEDGKITNNKLPRGEWYWSVYVEAPRKSSVFAPIYRLIGQTHATEGYERKHATVNNYPETDGFGNIIVAHNPSVTDEATRANRGLHIYGLNPDGNSNDEQANINNNTRYGKRAEYLNKNAEGRLHYPRRLAVGPDGKIYIADEGSSTANRTTQGGVIHEHGGVKVWDPANPNKFALFSDNRIGTATGVALYDYNGWKLYANNTYNEFSEHGSSYTKEDQDNPSSYGWNGFVRYTLDQYTSGHNGSWAAWGSNATEYALRRGDASGNFAFAPMEKGIWICQYREHTVALKTAIQQPLADNFEAYILSFVPYGTDIRTWKSSESIGVKSYSNGTPVWDNIISPYSQTTTAPLQSTPGGGVAYKKTNGKEYVYVVNHDGNIAVLEITGWTGTGVSATPIIPVNNIKILATPEFTKVDREVPGTSTKWHTAYITSMCFDYAGNLITTTGKGYHDAPQDIIVYTMPYDRVNAREIQAPNSCRYIPERVSHLNMGDEELSNIISENQGNTCHVDIFRPMFNTSFSTICLPFDVDLSQASANEYKDAQLMKFAEAVITDINKEKMLELRFTEITDGKLEAGIPYLIQPQEPITQIVHLAQLVSFESITPKDQKWDFTDGDQKNSITFKGIIPYQQIEVDPNKPWPLIVVDNNRLAEVSTTGYINGFRAYFQLEKELAPDTKVGISTRKPTPTNVITIDGKRVNIEKFLREGRVYIRVGDSLYTITGEKVE